MQYKQRALQRNEGRNTATKAHTTGTAPVLCTNCLLVPRCLCPPRDPALPSRPPPLRPCPGEGASAPPPAPPGALQWDRETAAVGLPAGMTHGWEERAEQRAEQKSHRKSGSKEFTINIQSPTPIPPVNAHLSSLRMNQKPTHACGVPIILFCSAYIQNIVIVTSVGHFLQKNSDNFAKRNGKQHVGQLPTQPPTGSSTKGSVGGAQRRGSPCSLSPRHTEAISPPLPRATSSCPSRAQRRRAGKPCDVGRGSGGRTGGCSPRDHGLGLQPHSTAPRLSCHPSSKQHAARPRPANAPMLKSSLLACSVRHRGQQIPHASKSMN